MLMDYLAPRMFDDSNMDLWKFKMSSYLKALDYIFILPPPRNHILKMANDKYLEDNVQALIVLRKPLSKEQLSMVSHCDSTFTVWNTLSSLKEQPSKKCGERTHSR